MSGLSKFIKDINELSKKDDVVAELTTINYMMDYLLENDDKKNRLKIPDAARDLLENNNKWKGGPDSKEFCKQLEKMLEGMQYEYDFQRQQAIDIQNMSESQYLLQIAKNAEVKGNVLNAFREAVGLPKQRQDSIRKTLTEAKKLWNNEHGIANAPEQDKKEPSKLANAIKKARTMYKSIVSNVSGQDLSLKGRNKREGGDVTETQTQQKKFGR